MIDKREVEICDQQHQMYAEGAHDKRPHDIDIISLLRSEGYTCSDIDIRYDKMMGLFRWTCNIQKVEPSF